MNWFTKEYFFSLDLEKKKRIISKTDESCDHVAADASLLYAVARENDSFGSESICLCQACAEKAEEYVNSEEHTCYDCKSTFTLKDGGVLWKWYDFYAAQGDEALPICKTCRTGNAHIRRSARDREDETREMNYSYDDNE